MKIIGILLITIYCIGPAAARSSDQPTNLDSNKLVSQQLLEIMNADDDLSKEVDPNGDAWPWPWGTECPFPWFMIEGIWQIESENVKGYFGFKDIQKKSDGRHAFTILRFSKSKELEAYGRGVADVGSRIISVIMHNVGPGHEMAYTAHFRAYRKKDRNGCQKDGMVTAVTVMPFFGDYTADRNFTIIKAISEEGFPDLKEPKKRWRKNH